MFFIPNDNDVKFLVLISLGLILLLGMLSINADAMNYKEFAVERVINQNHDWVDARSKLQERDKITVEQANTRIESIIYWSKKMNDNFPTISYKRVAKDLIEIMLHETRGVNYWSYGYKDNREGVLDGGYSFGIFSIQWRTAYWIAGKNNWELHDRNDEVRIMKNPREQTKYAVWYIYFLYNYMEDKAINKYNTKISINKIRHAVLQGWNRLDINPVTERKRNYFYIVLGRITQQEDLIKKRVDEQFDWEVV